MKRIFLIAVLLLVAIPEAFSAGTMTYSVTRLKSVDEHGIWTARNTVTVTIAWTSNSSGNADAETTTAVTDAIQGYVLQSARTVPGTGVSSYALNVYDQYAGDAILSLTGRSTTVAETGYPTVPPVIFGYLHIYISGAGNAKSGTVILVFTERPVVDARSTSITSNQGEAGASPWLTVSTPGYDSTIVALPNSSTSLTASTTVVKECFCNNSDTSSRTVTITDTAGNYYVGPAFVIPALSNVTFWSNPVGLKMVGIKWSADVAGKVFCQISGN